VKTTLDNSNAEEELKSIESLYRGTYAGGYAKLKLAQMAKRQGNDLVAKRYLTELEKEYRGTDYMTQAKELLDMILPSIRSKYTVGVILPLSGIYGPFGERALQGIQSAIKETDSPLISLAIRDSKGDPEEAGKAVEELVNVEKAIAIIGPLLSIDVDSAAKKAQQLRVPLLSLSQKELPKGDFVFQNSLTPPEQVQSLANFAVKELELHTFAVFYPNTPYGLYFKNLFSQEITRRGGKILGSVAYQEGQTDFSQEIKGFFRIKPVQKQDTRGKKEDEFKSLLSVDGIFIPDSSDRAGIILPPKATEAAGKDFAAHPVCSGPFRFGRYRKDAELQLIADKTHFSKPSVDEVWAVATPSIDGLLGRLQSGDIDLIESSDTHLTPSQAKQLADSPDLTIVRTADLNWLHGVPRASNMPWRDYEFRRAWHHSIDREFLVKVVWDGAGRIPLGDRKSVV
jgi:hypothetical protein